MSDVFREVDEDIRREQMKRLWSRYGRYLIAGAVLIVVAVAGYQIYQSMQESAAAESGDRFEDAAALYEAGDLEGALAGYESLVEDGHGDYPDLAAIASANVLAELGETDRAVEILDSIAADSSVNVVLRDAAEIRAAYLLAGIAPLQEIRSRLEPFAAEGDAYRSLALEIMAVAAIDAGDLDAATAFLFQMLQDPGLTQQAYERALDLFGLVTAQQENAPVPAVEGAPADAPALPPLGDALPNADPGFGGIAPVGEAPALPAFQTPAGADTPVEDDPAAAPAFPGFDLTPDAGANDAGDEETPAAPAAEGIILNPAGN